MVALIFTIIVTEEVNTEYAQRMTYFNIALVVTLIGDFTVHFNPKSVVASLGALCVAYVWP